MGFVARAIRSKPRHGCGRRIDSIHRSPSLTRSMTIRRRRSNARGGGETPDRVGQQRRAARQHRAGQAATTRPGRDSISSISCSRKVVKTVPADRWVTRRRFRVIPGR